MTNQHRTVRSRQKGRSSAKMGANTGPFAVLGRLRQLFDWQTVSLLGFVLVTFLFGGGPGEVGWQFLLIAGSGLVLLLTAALGGKVETFKALPLVVRLAVLASLALPLMQIVPLPPVIWSNLPGHELRIAILTEFGLGDRWQPLSMSPASTAYSAAMALAAFALFISILDLSSRRLMQLLRWIMLLIVVSIAVGIVQFASNGATFEFYQTTHSGSLVGFFTNKNHTGLTIACAIPLAYVLLQRLVTDSPGWLLVGVAAVAAILAIMVATNSRAGLSLGILAIVMVCLYHFSQHRKRALAIILGLLIVGGTLAYNIPVVGDFFTRVGDAGNDPRGEMLVRSEPLLTQFLVVGSGLGSYADIYASTEQLEWVSPSYVNHLHNDILQLVIEAGLPGILVLILWSLAILAALRDWRGRGSAASRGHDDMPVIAWLGLQIVLLFAIHSVVDYPIRRMATLMVLTVALALIMRPLLRLEPQRTQSGEM